MLEEIFAGKKELFEDGMQSILRGQENRYRRIKMEVLWKTAVPRLRECAQTYIRME